MRYSIKGVSAEQVRSAGATRVREAPRTGVLFATLTETQVDRLRALGAKVTSVKKVEPSVMPPVPIVAAPVFTAEQLIQVIHTEEIRRVTRPPVYGEGFNLAIVDTGIRESHQQINGRVVYRQNFTADPMEDGFDHGTGVASIALAPAPKCNLLNIKVLDNEGRGTEEEVVMGLEHLLELHDTGSEFAPHVINLSLGGPDTGDPDEPMRVAVRAAVDRGIWVMAAAGNGGPDPQTIMSPATEPYIGAIGSVRYVQEENGFVISEFSSRGPTLEGVTKPSVVMFGEKVVMASSNSDTATEAKSGTSFATPIVSGLVLLGYEALKEQVQYIGEVRGVPEQTVKDLIQQVLAWQQTQVYLPKMCIKPAGLPPKDNAYGWGLPFGPLIARTISLAPALDISALIMPMLLIPIMGTMMKVVK